MDEAFLERFGPEMTPAHMVALEAAAQFVLPESFRTFLFRHAGSFVNAQTRIDFEGGPSDLLQFHGVVNPYDPNTSDVSVLRVGSRSLGYPAKSVVFADDLGGNAYYLSAGSETTAVYWMGYAQDDGASFVASSFESFLNAVELSAYPD